MKQFPPSFRFGIGDADLQVVGEDDPITHEQAQPSMWGHFARTTDHCHQHIPPGRGVARYERWAEDAELIARLGVRDYRTSISFSRLQHADGTLNPAALEWYKRYFDALRSKGIRIYATLYHWELPQTLAERGGWTSRETVDAVVRHADLVAQHLHDFIEEYFIVNEPWCIAIKGYYLGGHAPGITDLRSAILASHHVLLAMGLGAQAVWARRPEARVGSVFNVEAYYASSASEADLRARALADGHFNRWFLDPVYTGRYPQDMLEQYAPALPELPAADMRNIAIGSKFATLGINYYSGHYVTADANPLGFRNVDPPAIQTNDLGWPIAVPPQYPSAFTDQLISLYHAYRTHGLKRIMITENGMAQHTPWDGRSDVLEDCRRVSYLHAHIAQIHDAIRAGVPVEGYFAWTLMDNYEWEDAFRSESCFGIVHVDRATMRRIPKTSYHWYADLVRRNALAE